MTKHRPPTISSDERPYNVGYGKPPKTGRFPPGNNANPAGRRGKKPKSFAQQTLEVLNRKVPGERGKEISLLQAIILAQVKAALQNKSGAANFILRTLQYAEASPTDSDFTKALGPLDHEIIRDFMASDEGRKFLDGNHEGGGDG